MATNYLACDLGAESGRVMAGTLDHGRLTLRELHRFANTPRRQDGSLSWNFAALMEGVRSGLAKAAEAGLEFSSVSTDSWGVDYALFDSAGRVMEPVFHYRDARSQRGVETAWQKLDWPAVFEETGIQFMPINTLFQLAAENRGRLESAEFLLGIGDAINYLLCGEAAMEASMASTFQLYNPRTGEWSAKLLDALRIPRRIMPRIVGSGTELAPLRPELAQETGLAGIEVIATCSHDTGAAVAGVPASGSNWAYLSSGTWSLMGVELDEPLVNDATRDLNFTNEIGFGNSVRFLKNLSGLWLVQECRRAWAAEGKEFTYADLTERAREATAFRALINPAAPEFLAPENMPRQIAEFCRRTGQQVPANEGELVRTALESLALLYRRTAREIERVTGRKIERLHIVGGGSQNDLLNQFTANALGIPVAAGPAEATAAGNILIQAITLGHLPSLAAARDVVRNSFTLRAFNPEESAAWDAAAERFPI